MKVDQRLRSLSPLWYERISKAKSLRSLRRKYNVDEIHNLFTESRTLDIEAFEGCMVGEAYMFDKSYINDHSEIKCKKCMSIAQRVFYPIRNVNHFVDKETGIKYFQRVIREFCNHAERKHGAQLGN